jgi:hypothetical protein
MAGSSRAMTDLGLKSEMCECRSSMGEGLVRRRYFGGPRLVRLDLAGMRKPLPPRELMASIAAL